MLFFFLLCLALFLILFLFFFCSSRLNFSTQLQSQAELSKYLMRAINVKCIVGVSFRKLTSNGLKQSYLWRLARKLQNKDLVVHTFDRNACAALCDLVTQVSVLPDAVMANVVMSTEHGCSFISVFLFMAARLHFSVHGCSYTFVLFVLCL